MKQEDAEEFTQSLGQIVGGSWRQIALARKLGVPKALGLTVDEWVNKRLGGYIKQTVEDRRKATEELSAAGESTRSIAAVLGISHATVERDLGTNVPDREDNSLIHDDADADSGTNVVLDPTAESTGDTIAPIDAVAALAASDQVKGAATMRKRWADKAAEVKRQVSLPDAKYRVIYADPPWSYGNTQPSYHTEQRDHYPVMSLAEICAMKVADIAEDNAVLFLWVTSPILEEAFQVIRAWRFVYKASFVWDKVKHNMGHYNSVRHEFLLICTRGSGVPEIPKLFDSVVTQERGEHSSKPEIFYEMIETIYPSGKRVEMFLRGAPREGWDGYGHEAADTRAA